MGAYAPTGPECPLAHFPTGLRAIHSDPLFTSAFTTPMRSWPTALNVASFMRAHQDVPAAYAEINNATRPIRSAAAAAGDPDRMNLWAGQGYRAATTLHAGEIVEMLCRSAAARSS